MNIKTLATAACLSLLTMASSFATTFTVGGEDFDVTTINGTFSDNIALLEAQVWWGNETLASSFADEVSGGLGLPNFGTFGPFFVFRHLNAPNPIGFRVEGYLVPDDLGSSSDRADITNSQLFTYAVATPVSAVPLPAGGLLLLSGLAGVAGLQRRKKRAA